MIALVPSPVEENTKSGDVPIDIANGVRKTLFISPISIDDPGGNGGISKCPQVFDQIMSLKLKLKNSAHQVFDQMQPTARQVGNHCRLILEVISDLRLTLGGKRL